MKKRELKPKKTSTTFVPWKITEVYHTEVEYFNEAELKRMAENLCKLMDNSAVTVTCNASVNQRIATKANNAKPAFSLGAKGKAFNKIKKQAIASRKIIPLL